ncbi:hypothetical protein OAH22_03015, partial [bacterium]|nr:hypothetical protein [bacterium]
MTTQQWPDRVRRRFVLAVALACSAPVMTSQASEPNEFDGFSQINTAGLSGQRSNNVRLQSPRRLPSIMGSTATISEATSAEPLSEAN